MVVHQERDLQGYHSLEGHRQVPLRLVESYDGGRHRFDGEVSLSRPGPFGYTVRVLPANPLLVAPAELGVVALA